MSNITTKDINYLLSPKAIRETTAKIYQRTLAGETHFKLNEDKLEACADFVLEVINDNYPTLDIPFHSRWGHFQVGGVDRLKGLEEKIKDCDALEKARIKLDLVVTSVLLDAGAGPTWKFREGDRFFNRSEGLAVASYYLFLAGVFSSDGSLQADSKGLLDFNDYKLKEGFQVNDENPLVGLEGRVALLQSLGKCLHDNPFFPGGRAGNMLDYLLKTHGKTFEVKDILDVVLKGLGKIWPGRIEVEGYNLGDVWHYKPLGELGLQSVVCFHKLSQWLTYSLVTPMLEAGCEITGAEKLTGLAEYRNGGLFLDYGVIELKDETLYQKSHLPSSDLIIEWRALTLQLLDRIGEIVQKKLNKTPQEFPLAKVLEGGTWWAGRRLAAQKRQDSSPPLKLESDGTVF